jgi:hypothetical protein
MPSGYLSFALFLTDPYQSQLFTRLPLVQFAVQVFVHDTHPWKGVLETLLNPSILTTTSIVLTSRTGPNVESRCVVYSHSTNRPWGLEEIGKCENVTCRSSTCAIVSDWKGKSIAVDGKTFYDPHYTLALNCRQCRKSSKKVARPNWLHPIESMPMFYWFQWPLSSTELDSLRVKMW